MGLDSVRPPFALSLFLILASGCGTSGASHSGDGSMGDASASDAAPPEAASEDSGTRADAGAGDARPANDDAEGPDGAADGSPSSTSDGSPPDSSATAEASSPTDSGVLPEPDAIAPIDAADDASTTASQLQDPGRITLPYECDGTTLTLPEVLSLFDPGTATKMIGLTGEIAAQTWSRTCAPLTGCTTWTAASTPANAFAFQLLFTGFTVSTMVARGYDAYFDDLGQELVPVSEGDFMIVNDPTVNPERIRLTHPAAGGICVSVATPLQDGIGGQQSFSVGKGTLSPSMLARSAATDRPALESAPDLCPGPGASTAAIAAAWFQPGTSTVDVPATRYDVAGRSCHPVTGCTAWGQQQNISNPEQTLPIPLRLNAGTTTISVQLSDSSNNTITNGLFSGTFGMGTGTFHGVVSTTCIGNRTDQTTDLTGSVQQEYLSLGLSTR
jgi:hypothetical protein